MIFKEWFLFSFLSFLAEIWQEICSVCLKVHYWELGFSWGPNCWSGPHLVLIYTKGIIVCRKLEFIGPDSINYQGELLHCMHLMGNGFIWYITVPPLWTLLLRNNFFKSSKALYLVHIYSTGLFFSHRKFLTSSPQSKIPLRKHCVRQNAAFSHFVGPLLCGYTTYVK